MDNIREGSTEKDIRDSGGWVSPVTGEVKTSTGSTATSGSGQPLHLSGGTAKPAPPASN